MIVNECCRNLLKKLFHDFLSVAQDLDLPVWMDYGTLLGAARESKMIDHDNDIDFSVLDEYREKIDLLSKKLNDAGYHTGFSWNGSGLQIYISEINRLHLDLFIWRDKGGMLDRAMYTPGTDDNKGKQFPRAWLGDLTLLEMEGRLVAAPEKYKELIAYRYGDKWLEPMTIYHFNNYINQNKEIFNS